MKIKTSELTGAALDWAVAKCEGVVYHGPAWTKYSTDWSQGGAIIEREKINIYEISGVWKADIPGIQLSRSGPTPLIASMRCYVKFKLGDTVDVPEELI